MANVVKKKKTAPKTMEELTKKLDKPITVDKKKFEDFLKKVVKPKKKDS